MKSKKSEFEKCDKAMEDFDGRCCCNCIFHKKIMKHPWNKGEGEGSISEQMGWGCAVSFDDEDRGDQIIFFNKEHGMCEMHTYEGEYE